MSNITMTDEELEKAAGESKRFVGGLASAPHVYERMTSYESGFKNGYRMCEKQRVYKTADVLPNSFGAYLVVIDEAGFGRRAAFKTFIPKEPYDDMHKELLGTERQTGWILGKDETLVYWMDIPDWP